MAHNPVSKTEARLYYYGLPSCPRLVGRSSTLSIPWEEPWGAFEYPKRKELRVVGSHQLNDTWGNNLAPLVLQLLELNGVLWTSIDVIRIGYSGEPVAPVIVWVGVTPKTLNHVEGTRIALACKDLFVAQDTNDVEVEFRESVVQRFAGSRLYDTAFNLDPTVEVRRPVTGTLGLEISAQPTPWAEGTGGIYLAEGGESRRIFLVTARHVVLPPETSENDPHEHKHSSQAQVKVLLLGNDDAFQRFVGSIGSEVKDQDSLIKGQEASLKTLEGEEVKVKRERERAKALLDHARIVKDELVAFQEVVNRDWRRETDRTIGHVIFAPPINADGSAKFTEDYAIIELEKSKLNMQEINVLDLGTKVSGSEINETLHPHSTNPPCFEYPPRRLMRLRGIIPTSELLSPPPCVGNGQECGPMVMKRGRATGLTIGCGNSILSIVRYYFKDGPPLDSNEWAVLAANRKFAPFSAAGDSGAIIIDGKGRVGGLLTGGTLPEHSTSALTDITYATPFEFLLGQIKQKFPGAHLHPVSAPDA